MIYKSNLTCPDLTPHFKHLHSRVMPHSMGHDVPSDWADKADDDPVFGIYKRCGMWTHDEAAILYNVAHSLKGDWCDIGSHTGWTSAHIGDAFEDGHVVCVDPLLALDEVANRCLGHLNAVDIEASIIRCTSASYFDGLEKDDDVVEGFCIDGDHEPGKPLEDAQHAVEHLADTGVIMLHDGTGRPVREAVEFLIRERFHARVYYTPHIVFCCWRGDFKPPDHVPDPRVLAEHTDGRYPDFDWSRCE